MNPTVSDVLNQILRIRPVLHGAGTLSGDALGAIARHAGRRRIRRSVETGCGASTLLLSHLSEHHTVFALDFGGSVANVRRSPLLTVLPRPSSIVLERETKTRLGGVMARLSALLREAAVNRKARCFFQISGSPNSGV